uniref:Uncharacterized protein n=1 Tax=Corvus moneduloides TaxID=1196302 RepID=A0A8U7NPB9_CORMO
CQSLSGTDVQGLSTKAREGHSSPCAVSVLLSWAGLLAQRQLLASGSAAERQLWPGAAPGHSPAGLGHCLQPAWAQHRGTQGLNSAGAGKGLGSDCGRITPSPWHRKPLAAGHGSCSSWRDLLKLQHPSAYGFCAHGQRQPMSNSSSIIHFLLLALADTRQLQLLHFCLFLGISLAALLGNGLIISAGACGQHLHSPMFFFLPSLALTDLGSICTTVPKAMHNSLWGTRHISYTGCATQV